MTTSSFNTTSPSIERRRARRRRCQHVADLYDAKRAELMAMSHRSNAYEFNAGVA